MNAAVHNMIISKVLMFSQLHSGLTVTSTSAVFTVHAPLSARPMIAAAERLHEAIFTLTCCHNYSENMPDEQLTTRDIGTCTFYQHQ